VALARVVSEILNVEKRRDLEIGVRGHSSSLTTMTFKPGLGSLKIIGTDTCRSATYDFLLTFHSNHGPISYLFLDKRKSQNFPTPCILRPCWRGFCWNCVPAPGVKN